DRNVIARCLQPSRPLFAGAAMVFVTLSWNPVFADAKGPNPPPQPLPAPAVHQKHPKIDSTLTRVADAANGGMPALATAAREQRIVVRGDKIRVLIETTGHDSEASEVDAAVMSAGGYVEASYGGTIQ